MELAVSPFSVVLFSNYNDARVAAEAPTDEATGAGFNGKFLA